MTPEEYYDNLKNILLKKRKTSVNSLIDFLCSNLGAREICLLTNKQIPDYIKPFELTEFELKLFNKEYTPSEDINIIEEDNTIIEPYSPIKKNINELKIRNHIFNLKNKERINFKLDDLKFKFKEHGVSDIQLKYLNNFFYNLEKNIDFFAFKLIYNLTDIITYFPKFSLDYFNKENFVNFLYDRKYNLNDYNTVEDFFQEYCGEAAIDADSLKWQSLNFYDCYKKEIELFIFSLFEKNQDYNKNEDLQNLIQHLTTEHLLNIFMNFEIKDIFYIYNFTDNISKFNIFKENSFFEESVNSYINDFVSNIKNINNKRIFLLLSNNEEESEFDFSNYSIFKEMSFSNQNKFKNNFSNYYCDTHNINLFITIEETNIKTNNKTAAKIEAFYFHNKKATFLKKDSIDLTVLPNKFFKEYQFILK